MDYLLCINHSYFTLQPDAISLRCLNYRRSSSSYDFWGIFGFCVLCCYLVLITKYFNDISSRIHFCFDGDVRMINSSAKKSKLELSSEVTFGSLSLQFLQSLQGHIKITRTRNDLDSLYTRMYVKLTTFQTHGFKLQFFCDQQCKAPFSQHLFSLLLTWQLTLTLVFCVLCKLEERMLPGSWSRGL